MSNQLGEKCPHCGKENDIVPSHAFLLDAAEYSCNCGYKLYQAEWEFMVSVKMLKLRIEIERERERKQCSYPMPEE